MPKFKKKDEKLPTKGVVKTFATHFKNQDEKTVTPKEKTKSDKLNDYQSEEIKILSRDVKILKQDCAKLRHHVHTMLTIDRQSEYYSMDDKHKTTQRSFGYYEGKSAYNTNWYEETEGSKQYKSFAEYGDEYQ